MRTSTTRMRIIGTGTASKRRIEAPQEQKHAARAVNETLAGSACAWDTIDGGAVRMPLALRRLPALLAVVASLSEAAGLDSTFGAGGVLPMPAYSLALQPDGKIVVLGAASRSVGTAETGRFTLSRL